MSEFDKAVEEVREQRESAELAEGAYTAQLVKYHPTREELALVEHRFTYHVPRQDQIPRFVALRNGALEMARRIQAMCPPSRETSLALTKLEESIAYANAAIARNEK